MDDKSFEWDEAKRLINIEKHGIDFWDALDIFDVPHVVKVSHRNNEERWMALGLMDDTVLAVVYTKRDDVIRIISARPASQNERYYYNTRFPG